MDEKRSIVVLFLVVVVMVLVLRALKREGESVKRERCSSSRDDDGSRPILIGRERGSIGASAHKRLLPNENSFSRSVCSPKDGRSMVLFFLSTKIGRKKWSTTRIFDLSTNGQTSLFLFLTLS